MKIKKIKYDEKRNPAKVTVQMSIVEAAFISTLTGTIPSIDFKQISPDGMEIASEIYDCLIGECFNRHWEDGISEFRGKNGWPHSPHFRLGAKVKDEKYLAHLEAALNAVLADTGCEEDGSYIFESARNAEELLKDFQ